MSFSDTVKEISTWSVEDRIRLVQEVWDSIAAEDKFPELTEEQKRDLDRRIAELDASPDNVLTWEEIKAKIRGQ